MYEYMVRLFFYYFAFQVSGIRMRAKHRQARISPKFVKLEVPKHRQARISPKSPKSWHLCGLRGHSC